MADQLTRAIPTPRDLTATEPGTFDRARWERALLAADLHRNARLLDMVLAHHAAATGYLPAGGIQHAGRLAQEASITPKATRLSLFQLEVAGFIQRPDLSDWQPKDIVRPVTLTLPSAAAAARSGPHHPCEAEE